MAPNLQQGTRSSLDPLHGHVVGVTASRRADDQVRLFEWAGAQCLSASAVETVALGSLDEQRRLIEEVVRHAPGLVVVTTEVGVRHWFDVAAVLGLHDVLADAIAKSTCLARGSSALAALDSLGVEPREASVFETYDALLASLSEHDLTGRHCVVQVDGSGAHSLCAGLDSLGANVAPAAVYRSVLPDDVGDLERLAVAACEGRVDALTFTARPAVTNFLSVITELGLDTQLSSAIEGGSLACFAIGSASAAPFVAADLPPPLIGGDSSLGSLVAAVIRHFAAERTEIELGGHSIRIQGRAVCIAGEEEVAELTERERSVLRVLVERPGVVYDKQSLLRAVWGDTHTDEHLVEVTIARLRQRLGIAGQGIETVVRRGYRVSAT